MDIKILMDNYVKVLKKWNVFDGRSGRREYWHFFFVNLAISIALGIIDGRGNSLSALYSLILLLPSIAVGIRRLHDTNRSGWYLLIGLIPLIGWIVLIIFAIEEGSKEANAYGTPPTDEGPVFDFMRQASEPAPSAPPAPAPKPETPSAPQNEIAAPAPSAPAEENKEQQQ
jgi:uncharacterized membrane protein YhaH (DUF805 family)